MNISLSELERKFLNEILSDLCHVKSTNDIFTISGLVIDKYFALGSLTSEDEVFKMENNISKFLQENKFVKTPTDEVTYSFTDKGMDLLALGSIDLYEEGATTLVDAKSRKNKIIGSLGYVLSVVKLAQ